MQPTKRLIGRVREKCPGAKIIGFPRGAGEKIPEYVDETGVDAVVWRPGSIERFASAQHSVARAGARQSRSGRFCVLAAKRSIAPLMM